MVPMTLMIPKNRFGAPLRCYHRFVWLLAKVFRLLYPLRVEGAERLPRSGPAVVIAPHMSYSDSFLFVYAALPRPVRFVAGAFHVLANAPLSWIAFLGGAIPIWKHVPDMQAARQILRLLAAGEVVALFPEGERAWSGVPVDPLTPSAKFLARLKVPVYVAEIEGAYDHWPRWDRRAKLRRVTVRVHGPLALPKPSNSHDGVGPCARWWDAVYRHGGQLDTARAGAAVARVLHDTAHGEASRLDLFRLGRFRHVPRLICFCPECARPQPLVEGRRLACLGCGAAWTPTHGGAVLRENPYDEQGPRLLSDLFVRMLETLRRRTQALLPLEEPVAVTVMNHATGPAVAGRARLDRHGVVVMAAAKQWEIDLAAVARGEVEGSGVLEVRARCGATLSLKSDGGALRLALAACALLDHPWGRFISTAPRAPGGAGESCA